MARELIAILRGITPPDAERAAVTLMNEGFSTIEVPLNSPDAFSSIQAMLRVAGPNVQIGAGTVLDTDAVARLADIGAHLVVSPDCQPDVIRATKLAGMASFPGVMTPTEAFSALRAGADGLKFFPASLIGPDGIQAMRAVLPAECKTYAVGGAGPDNFADWFAAGVTGFGIGSALYKPGMSVADIALRAKAIVAAYDAAAPQ
jgi:2-dehydro-3-deoxyphosphogalactonate aldolase